MSETLRLRIITALVMLAILLAILFSQSNLVFAIAATVMFAASAWECFRLFRNQNPMIGAAMWTAAFGWILYSTWSGDPARLLPLFALCAAIWVLLLVPALKLGLPPLEGMGNRLLNGIFGIAILGCFVAITVLFKRHGALYLLSVLAIVWVADIGAYAAGRAFGKHKLAPTISPGKSWEGAIGGWVAVLLLAALCAYLAPNGTFPGTVLRKWNWLGFALVMSLLAAASVVGDLVESQLKRRAGVKDSSSLLPGHGGLLDRIDALIPVLPLAALLDAL
jgi:phosphatidate cytidylyltransferase